MRKPTDSKLREGRCCEGSGRHGHFAVPPG